MCDLFRPERHDDYVSAAFIDYRTRHGKKKSNVGGRTKARPAASVSTFTRGGPGAPGSMARDDESISQCAVAFAGAGAAAAGAAAACPLLGVGFASPSSSVCGLLHARSLVTASGST